MKMSKGVLMKFLKKVSVNNYVWECVIKFEEKGISCSVNTGFVYMSSLLPASLISDYKSGFSIGIKDLKLIQNMVNSFRKEFELDKKDNLLIMKDESKVIESVTADPNFVRSTEWNDLSYNNEVNFSFNSANIKGILSDTAIFGVSRKEEMANSLIYFEGIPGKLIVTIDATGNKVRREFDVPEIQTAFKTSFGDKLITDVLKSLSGNLKIKTQNQGPIEIFEEDDGIISHYVVAPRIDDEVKEESK